MKLIRYMLAISIAFLLCGDISIAENAMKNSGKGVLFEAKEIDGEIYIKAASFEQLYGGHGTFDAATGTYSFKPENRIASIVQQISPSIVAIIGRPSDSGNSKAVDRFSLAHGTGIIVKADGWIATNAHVIKDMKQIVVVTSDGKQYTASQTMLDEESDLALLKISAKDLPEAVFADNMEVQVGETVVAIGTPLSFALRNTVTVGVVSGTDRSIHSMYRLLQTDAAINPGNSGGALVNLDGEIIGVTSLKYSGIGVDSLGFAIPSDTVKYVMDQLFEHGKVRRSYLGFDVEESWAALVGLPTEDPLKVSRVDESTARRGVKAGDVLYSIGQVNVRTIVDLNEELKKYMPGQTVKVMFQSGGDLIEREIVLVERKK